MKRLFTLTALVAMSAPVLADSWTPWLDRDNADGNGDYETRADFGANQVCAQPKAIEAMIAGSTTVYRPGDTVPNTLVVFDPSKGLICRGQDQISGISCADYSVRFNCPDREDLTRQFPVLKDVDLENAIHAQSAQSFRSVKKVNRARSTLGAGDIPTVKSLFRLGQGYDPLNDQYRNECLDQSHPDFYAEQVPVTTPTRMEVKMLTTSQEVYSALSQSTSLGVNLGFAINDTDIKFGVSTSSDVFKAEYFQSTRAVFALTFETVVSQYLLNTQPRPIKDIIAEGVPGDLTKGPLLQPHSENHKRSFFKECGDRFLDGVGMGAKLTVMFHYDKKNFSEQKNRELQVTVGAAIEELLTVGLNQQRAEQLVQLLASVGVEYDVVNFGGPAFPETLASLVNLAQEVDDFKNGITEDNAVAITESFREYNLPAIYQNYAHYDVFADTRDQLLNARHFSAITTEFAARCKDLKDYNSVLNAGFDATQCNAKDNLPAHIDRGRDNCSITANWQDCIHPIFVNVLNGTPLLNVLEEKIKAFAPKTEYSGIISKSETGGVWNKKCIEDTVMTCLPTSCAVNIKEGGHFGVGQGFAVEPWDYLSQAVRDEQGYTSFTVTQDADGRQCVRSVVKACTQRIGGSRAHYNFAVELDGICPERQAFPID